MFGWALHESIARYPQVLSATEIERRLGISKNSALLLKRRLQLFASDQMEKIKSLMQAELTEKFPETKLPPTAGDQHVSTVIGDRPVPQADSCVLYSASQRANQGRKRHKHTGQTASIYLSDKLGGAQRGTLVHTLSWKNGPVIYDSIPNNQAQTLRPLLDKYIPKNVPIFTDEGYKFYFRINHNHRMVNHNRKSSDPRYRWARNRWSLNGVHNQVAEGNHRNLKYHFTAGYSYIRPEFSQLYLNEYAFWKNLKYYGWSKLIDQRLLDPRLKSHLPDSQVHADQSSGNATLTTLTTDLPIQLQHPKPMKPYVRRTSLVQRKSKPSSTKLSANDQTGNIPKKVELFHAGCITPVSGVRPDKEVSLTSDAIPDAENPVFRKNFSETVGPLDCTIDAGEAPPSRSLGKVRRKYPAGNWLKNSILAHTYRPPTLEERKRLEAISDDDDIESQIKKLIEHSENENLKVALNDYTLFKKRKKKHESASQKLYEFHANQIWEFLDDNEWSDLDSILDHLQISRAKAYRIIRTWAISGIADVVDRSHPDGYNFKLIYDIKRRISILPTVRYVLDRNEFVGFESRYGQSVQKQYFEKKSKEKYQ